MLKRIVGGMLLFVCCASIVLADEIRAVITKVDGDKITFTERKKKGEKGPEKTLPVASSLKVFKGKWNADTKKVEAADAIDDGLKSDIFTKIGEKGVNATIITDADNAKITEIRIAPPKGK